MLGIVPLVIKTVTHQRHLSFAEVRDALTDNFGPRPQLEDAHFPASPFDIKFDSQSVSCQEPLNDPVSRVEQAVCRSFLDVIRQDLSLCYSE